MPRLTAVLGCWLIILSAPAAAMVGGAAPAEDAIARQVVLIVGSRGFCTGTAIARELVLTAAHCVEPGGDYKLLEPGAKGQPIFHDVATVVLHPQFALAALQAHRATADVAVLKLAARLPEPFMPASLASASGAVKVGDLFTVAGYGVAVRGDGKTGGSLRVANLAATGHPGNLQIRLVDPATRNERSGLGACTGDSGAPVFDAANGHAVLIGIVTWSTGPNNSGGCGGITGVTPLALYRSWILETAQRMGATLVH